MAHNLSCPATGELKGTLPGSRSKQGFGTMKEAHKIMLACPDITSLDLRVTLLGCSDEPDRWNFPFRLAGGDVYPNLTSLKLEGYDFKQSDWAQAQTQYYGGPFGLIDWGLIFYHKFDTWYPLWRDIPQERRHLTNLQLWLEAMDWTKLESLTLVDRVDKHFAELATPHLKGLRNLSIRARWGENLEAAKLLITSLPAEVALTSLSWVDGWDPSVIEPLMDRHGVTLKRLELHSQEPWGKTVLSRSQIDMIGIKAPGLQHLSLSIDRNGSWPRETLQSLVSVQSLVSIDIWLQLAADGNKGERPELYFSYIEIPDNDNLFRQPRLNVNSATEAFSFLLENNKSSNLRNVTFYIGDWERPWDGPLNKSGWLAGRRGKVECSLYNEQGERKKPGEALCIHTVDEEGGVRIELGPPWDESLLDGTEYLRYGQEEQELGEGVEEDLENLQAQMTL